MFIKKSDDEGSDFYYLGEVEPLVDTITQKEKIVDGGKKLNVVQLNLHYKQAIENKLYKYLKQG